MSLALRYAAASHPGLLREVNQDSVYAGPHLLAVADGIGGSAAGEVASSIVIGAMAPVDVDVAADGVIDALRAGVQAADTRLREAMAADHALDGMGTTLTSLLFAGDTMGVAHIGDSRAYLLRGGELVQVTRDDSYVQLLVDEGRITAEEASYHPYRSVVTKAMQGSAPDAEYALLRVADGDRFLVCSDGLSGVVPAETLAEVLRTLDDPDACVERLIELALHAGGPDNITVVVADVTAGHVPAGAPVFAVASTSHASPTPPGSRPPGSSGGGDPRVMDDTAVFDRRALFDQLSATRGPAGPAGTTGHARSAGTGDGRVVRQRRGSDRDPLDTAGTVDPREAARSRERRLSGPAGAAPEQDRSAVRALVVGLLIVGVFAAVAWYLWRWLRPA